MSWRVTHQNRLTFESEERMKEVCPINVVNIIQFILGPNRTNHGGRLKFSFCPWTGTFIGVLGHQSSCFSGFKTLGLSVSGPWTSGLGVGVISSVPLVLRPAELQWIIQWLSWVYKLAGNRSHTLLVSIITWGNAHNVSHGIYNISCWFCLSGVPRLTQVWRVFWPV